MTQNHASLSLSKYLPLWSFLAVSLAIELPAQTPGDLSKVDADEVENRRLEMENDADLDDDAKQKLADVYRKAAAELASSDEFNARARQSTKAGEDIERRARDIKSELNRLQAVQPDPIPDGALVELERELAKREATLVRLKTELAKLENEAKARTGRRREIRELLAASSARRTEIQQKWDSIPADEPPATALARRTLLTCRRQAAELETTALQAEVARYDAEEAVDLLRLERDLKTQEVTASERNLKPLDERVKQLRAIHAQQALRKARDESIAAHPLLKPYTARNQTLAETAQTTAGLLNDAERELSEIRQTYDNLQRQFSLTRQKVDSVGLTNAVGLLLRKQRASLPDVRRHRANVRARRAKIEEIQFELFEFDDERALLSNRQPIVERIRESAAGMVEAEREWLAVAAREVLDRKREYLDPLIRAYSTCFDTLVEIDTTEQQLIGLTDAYHQYISERALWIRSGQLLPVDIRRDVADESWLAGSDFWLITPGRWRDVAAKARLAITQNYLVTAAAVLLFGVLAWSRRRMRCELRTLGGQVTGGSFCLFGPTWRAVLLTIVLAVFWPGLIGFVGWRLNAVANGSDFAKAVAFGLMLVAAVYLPLDFLRRVCTGSGLAEAHFGWPKSSAESLRKHLSGLAAIGLPLLFVTAVLHVSDPFQGRATVERIAFMLTAGAFALFLLRTLRPRGGVFQPYLAANQGGWADRLKYVWYWLAVASPLALAGLTFVGYFYTAEELSKRLYATTSFLAFLVVVRALLLRLLMLQRRKLAIHQAKERAASAAEAQTQTPSVQTPGQTKSPGLSSIIQPATTADLTTLSEQSRRLLVTGLATSLIVGTWGIWKDVLPALTMIDRWQHGPVVAQPLDSGSSATAASDNAPAGATDPPASQAALLTSASAASAEANGASVNSRFTFTNVALALLIGVIAFVSAHNIPGLLEMCILQRLPLDNSVRYAITSLARYTITLAGVIMAFGSVGITWSQVQWLATALTFGLAFGLQEIFANFVAGLILLFERPIRVGDVVTIGDVSGVVSRIRIRATSITNWDRKELIVPNKEFITGRLLNWTLSDAINRILINVGIAYGSDTEKAREVLLQVCNDHPLILKDPPTMVTFEGFGDSTLNFSVRTFLPNLENRLEVIHQLHTSIDKAFRSAGIEIAFPQRDLHVRSAEPIALSTQSVPEKQAA